MDPIFHHGHGYGLLKEEEEEGVAANGVYVTILKACWDLTSTPTPPEPNTKPVPFFPPLSWVLDVLHHTLSHSPVSNGRRCNPWLGVVE